MTLKSRISPFLTASLCFLLTSCATKPPSIPSNQEVQGAAITALGDAIHLAALSQDCIRLGGDIAVHAQEVQTQWLQRNWKWVAAADAHYSQDLSDQTSQYQGQDIAPHALKFLAEKEAHAERTIGFNKRSRLSREKICEKHLAPYQTGEKDFQKNAELGSALELLSNRYPQAATTPYRIPRLAGNLNPRSLPGRSQYNVESFVRNNGCRDPQLYTFRNEWPYEAYGAFCQNNEYFLVTCEWGKCNQGPPQ